MLWLLSCGTAWSSHSHFLVKQYSWYGAIKLIMPERKRETSCLENASDKMPLYKEQCKTIPLASNMSFYL